MSKMGEYIANVVCALAGRDKGKHFVVTAQEANFVYLCDGKSRKVGSPKKKKIKHVDFTGVRNEFLYGKLSTGGKITNKEVRYALADFRDGLSDSE